jgi:hypothetical protein
LLTLARRFRILVANSHLRKAEEVIHVTISVGATLANRMTRGVLVAAPISSVSSKKMRNRVYYGIHQSLGMTLVGWVISFLNQRQSCDDGKGKVPHREPDSVCAFTQNSRNLIRARHRRPSPRHPSPSRHRRRLPSPVVWIPVSESVSVSVSESESGRMLSESRTRPCSRFHQNSDSIRAVPVPCPPSRPCPPSHGAVPRHPSYGSRCHSQGRIQCQCQCRCRSEPLRNSTLFALSL